MSKPASAGTIGIARSSGEGDTVTETVERFQGWLAERLDATDLQIEDFRQHTEGFSWHTFTMGAKWTSDAGESMSRGFAFRVEPPDGVNAPYDVREQFVLNSALHGKTALPVPEAYWLEESPEPLGMPFYVMERMPGTVPTPWDRDVFASADDRHEIGRQFVGLQADIHQVDWRQIGLESLAAGNSPQECAEAEVQTWADYYAASVLVEVPIIRLAIGWLRANAAWTDTLVLVHGDFRIGNFMVDDGRISCMLDWEYAHIGDPLQDLAFTNLRLFRGRSPLVSGLIDQHEYLERYTDLTGIPVDPDVLKFWTVVSLVRAADVYVRGCSVFEQGRTDDLRMARMGHRLSYLMSELAKELGVA